VAVKSRHKGLAKPGNAGEKKKGKGIPGKIAKKSPQDGYGTVEEKKRNVQH